MICVPDRHVAQFCHIHAVELAAVVIVDRRLSVPDIRCRQVNTAVHGSHKAVIHEFLRPACRRTETAEVCPQQKEDKKNQLLSEHSRKVRRSFCFSQHKKRPAYTGGNHGDDNGASVCKLHQTCHGEHPYQISSDGDADRLRKYPAVIGKIAEQHTGQRIKAGAHEEQHQIPAQKGRKIRPQQRTCRRQGKDDSCHINNFRFF